mmetsp:Transcript_7323/g.10812  ORF Transcript_7323/g.10812 Transcript_7323/m.10812 type:complete len:299 (-) Transcript_7323:178-1074(-)|eukprot:CAMPEP_0196812516 /NCGR_PEP_ID=MMETSP1362-20130617/27245_1 /TAXON_ID=163516 /ORGANISM="Leptocylindrus danicus, Strain CCMP1856" /LENGTH=298 /DNA_ID=CAMNT_0042188213 /DNA_START=97 /DNA_END=993 /DNA_ORIENTATION=+
MRSHRNTTDKHRRVFEPLLRRSSMFGILQRITIKSAEPLPKINTYGASKLQRTIKSAHSQSTVLKMIQTDCDIQDLLRFIPMSSQIPASSHEPALREALGHGWVINGSSYSKSTRSGRHSSSIQAALDLFRQMADLEAAFCINPDDVLLNILRRSSRSIAASECKELLNSMLLGNNDSQDLYLNMIENCNPVQMETAKGGPGGSGCIFCVLQYTFPVQILRVTEDEDACPGLCHESTHSSIDRFSIPTRLNSGLDLYVDATFVETELLMFDAIVSDCFTFFGDGRIESFRRMKIVLNS